MMNDLISRQDAIAVIEAKEANEYGNYLEYNVAFNDGLRSAVFAIEELPSTEPERKTGKWLIAEKDRYIVHSVRCSVCGYCISWMANYCPNCGSKMEVQDD